MKVKEKDEEIQRQRGEERRKHNKFLSRTQRTKAKKSKKESKKKRKKEKRKEENPNERQTEREKTTEESKREKQKERKKKKGQRMRGVVSSHRQHLGITAYFVDRTFAQVNHQGRKLQLLPAVPPSATRRLVHFLFLLMASVESHR